MDEKTASIYAFRYPRGKSNDALDLEGWEPRALFRTSDFARERERGIDGHTPRWIGPFRTVQGETVMVRPAPCGVGCYCAAEYKVVAGKVTAGAAAGASR